MPTKAVERQVKIILTSPDGKGWSYEIQGLEHVPIYPVHLERGLYGLHKHLKMMQRRLVVETSARSLIEENENVHA